METLLFVVVAIYSIFLNLRIRELQDEIIDLSIDIQEIEIKAYNKMMDIRKEIKQSIKIKKVAKSRGGSTKKRSKVS